MNDRWLGKLGCPPFEIRNNRRRRESQGEVAGESCEPPDDVIEKCSAMQIDKGGM